MCCSSRHSSPLPITVLEPKNLKAELCGLWQFESRGQRKNVPFASPYFCVISWPQTPKPSWLCSASHILFSEHHSLISCLTPLSVWAQNKDRGKSGNGDARIPKQTLFIILIVPISFLRTPKQTPLFMRLSFPTPLSHLFSISSHHLGGIIAIGFIPFQDVGRVTCEWVASLFVKRYHHMW